VDRHDSALAGLGREVWVLGEACVLVCQAHEAKTVVFLGTVKSVGCGGTDGHAEALWKCCDLLVAVGVEILLSIIDRHSPINTVW